MFSKKKRNAIKRHKENLEQGKDLTDSEQVTIKDLSNVINLPTRSSINGQALDGFSTLQR